LPLPLPLPHTPAAALLQLMWLASPALPVGGFSYSEGLEAAVEAGHVSNEDTAGSWLLAQLQLQLARGDLPALAQACHAWQAHDAASAASVNQWLQQTRETAELLAQAQQMGRSLLQWLLNSVHGQPLPGSPPDPRLAQLAALQPAPLWPVAFALAAVLAGATPRDSLLAYGWGWAENMAQAAMKAVPLGQGAAQRILQRLALELPAAVDAALVLPVARWQAFAPMLAVLSAQHETQYSRLFRS
jgi:urease accessory protein